MKDSDQDFLLAGLSHGHSSLSTSSPGSTVQTKSSITIIILVSGAHLLRVCLKNKCQEGPACTMQTQAQLHAQCLQPCCSIRDQLCCSIRDQLWHMRKPACMSRACLLTLLADRQQLRLLLGWWYQKGSRTIKKNGNTSKPVMCTMCAHLAGMDGAMTRTIFDCILNLLL